MSLINDPVATGINVRSLFTYKHIERMAFVGIFLFAFATLAFLYGEWQYDRAHNAGRNAGYDRAMLEILSESSDSGGFSITYDGTVINFTIESVEQDAR